MAGRFEFDDKIKSFVKAKIDNLNNSIDVPFVGNNDKVLKNVDAKVANFFSQRPNLSRGAHQLENFVIGSGNNAISKFNKYTPLNVTPLTPVTGTDQRTQDFGSGVFDFTLDVAVANKLAPVIKGVSKVRDTQKILGTKAGRNLAKGGGNTILGLAQKGLSKGLPSSIAYNAINQPRRFLDPNLEANPVGDLATDFAFDAGLSVIPVVGSVASKARKSVAPAFKGSRLSGRGRIPNFHPEDAGLLDRISEILNSKKPKTSDVQESRRILERLADVYLTKDEIDKVFTVGGRKRIVNKELVRDKRLVKALQKKAREVKAPDFGFADNAFGAGAAGFSPNVDEEGKVSFEGFDPTKAALGFAGVSAVKKGKDFMTPKDIFKEAGGFRQFSQKADNITDATKSKYAFNINKDRLNIDAKAKAKVDKVVEAIRPALQKNKGKALGNDEIITGARKAMVLDEAVGREQAKEFSERLQASRNFLKAEAETTGVSPEFLNQLEIVSSQAADAGRRLRAFAVGAEDSTIKEKVLQDLIKLGKDADELVAAGNKVDWNNAKEVTDFYRKFKPASFADKLEEFRYTNMLSSPNTHIVNVFSNFIQTGLVPPIEKAIAGGLDFARSRLTGTEQKYFVRQGVDYAEGYFRALPTAWSKFSSTFEQMGTLTKPDVNMIPTGTSSLKRLYTLPLTALEAADQFFRELVKGGETKSLARAGITGAKAKKLAEQSADYRTFRQAFDPTGELGQNKVLQFWDKWNVAVNNLRHTPGGKWIVPFLQTPTNILKQGVEYSPLGLATVKGSTHPMEQLSKTIIGSSVFVGAYAMAESGLVTWDAPTSQKERSEFYAAGLQPYSIKIGDKWVSFSKLGPLSYPFAMASAMKWAEDEGVEENSLQLAGNGLVGFLQFFSDQSYVRGIGDAIDALRGDEFEQQRFMANLPSQLIPYRSLQGWVARLVDPVYRKPDGLVESLASQVPGLSSSLEPYTTPFGEPSERQFPLLNAFSPAKVSKERPLEKEFFELQKEARTAKRLKTKLKAGLSQEKTQLVKSTGGAVDKFAIAYGYDTYLDNKPVSSLKAKQYEKDVLAEARRAFKDENIPLEIKHKLIEEMGLKPIEVELDAIANSSVLERAVWVQSKLAELPEDQRMPFIYTLQEHKTLSGKRVATDSVLEELEITGVVKTGGKSGGRKLPTAINSGTVKRASVPKIKLPSPTSSAPKFAKINFDALTKSIKVPNLKTKPVVNNSEIESLRRKDLV